MAGAAGDGARQPAGGAGVVAERRGRARRGLRLGGALWRFWQVRGYWAEGREHLAGLLALPGAEAPTAARAKALHGAGMLA